MAKIFYPTTIKEFLDKMKFYPCIDLFYTYFNEEQRELFLKYSDFLNEIIEPCDDNLFNDIHNFLYSVFSHIQDRIQNPKEKSKEQLIKDENLLKDFLYFYKKIFLAIKVLQN